VHVANRDDEGAGQAALPGGTEAGSDHIGDRWLQHGIRHHHQHVLGAALRLHTLAVGGCTSVDRSRDRCRTDQGNAAQQGMIDQRLDGVPAAVDQVDDARWKANVGN
jgi:hypothetical protein